MKQFQGEICGDKSFMLLWIEKKKFKQAAVL